MWNTPEERTEYIRNALRKAGLSLELEAKVTGEDELTVTQEIMNLVISDVDRRVNKAVETNTEKLRKELGKTADAAQAAQAKSQGDNSKDQGTTADSKQPDLSKVVADALKPITDRIDAIEREKAGAVRSQTVRDALKKAGLSESFEKYVIVDDDTKIDEVVETFKKDVLANQQDAIDEALAKSGVPNRGSNATTVTEDMAKDYAKKRNDQSVGVNVDFPTVDIHAFEKSPSQTGVSKI